MLAFALSSPSFSEFLERRFRRRNNSGSVRYSVDNSTIVMSDNEQESGNSVGNPQSEPAGALSGEQPPASDAAHRDTPRQLTPGARATSRRSTRLFDPV